MNIDNLVKIINTIKLQQEFQLHALLATSLGTEESLNHNGFPRPPNLDEFHPSTFGTATNFFEENKFHVLNEQWILPNFLIFFI